MTTRAVILARGLGTRMRRTDGVTALSDAQAAVADTGVKGLVPVGRPFLDYAISALADAGIRDVCLVVGPEHDALHERYGSTQFSRVRIGFAVQAEPRGTADAVLAAERWTAGEPFLVVNSDNYYPVDAMRTLAALEEPGLVAFSREGLLNSGQISPSRVLSFAVLELTGDYLTRIIEKPTPAELGRARPGRVGQHELLALRRDASSARAGTSRSRAAASWSCRSPSRSASSAVTSACAPCDRPCQSSISRVVATSPR